MIDLFCSDIYCVVTDAAGHFTLQSDWRMSAEAGESGARDHWGTSALCYNKRRGVLQTALLRLRFWLDIVNEYLEYNRGMRPN